MLELMLRTLCLFKVRKVAVEKAEQNLEVQRQAIPQPNRYTDAGSEYEASM